MDKKFKALQLKFMARVLSLLVSIALTLSNGEHIKRAVNLAEEMLSDIQDYVDNDFKEK